MQLTNPRRVAAAAALLAVGALLAAAGCSRGGGGAAGEAGLDLLFMAGRQSKIEPCGCVQKQLGGVQYESALYARYPREGSLRVDLGGYTSALNAPEDSMRTRYALQAMGGELGLDAINVAARDLRLGAAFFQDLAEHFPQAADRLVSANILPEGDATGTAFRRFRVVERPGPDGSKLQAFITGVTTEDRSPLAAGANADGFLLADLGPSLEAALASARPTDLVVVMVHGDAETARGIARDFPRADVVLCSSDRRGAGDPADAKILFNQSAEGKLLGRARLSRSGEGKWALRGKPEWLEVSPSLDPSPALVALIEDYKRGTQETIIRRPKGVAVTFAGARSCAECHAAEHEDWKSTRHARALETLAAKGMQYDSRCLQCHTVGFARDNGFYNVQESMAMAGVQCEVCHGPAADHVEAERRLRSRGIGAGGDGALEDERARAKEVLPARQVEAATCLQCHTPENDDHFVYDEKIRKVNHSGVAAAAGAGSGRDRETLDAFIAAH